MPTPTSSSPRCFPCRRAGHGEHRCGRPLGRAAGAVGGGIAAAFFASLERCACVEVRTKEDDEADDAEAAPLVLRSPAAASGGRRAAASGKLRRGLGCCENSAVK